VAIKNFAIGLSKNHLHFLLSKTMFLCFETPDIFLTYIVSLD